MFRLSVSNGRRKERSLAINTYDDIDFSSVGSMATVLSVALIFSQNFKWTTRVHVYSAWGCLSGGNTI